MFDVEYKGGNTVVISTKKATIVTDPNQSVIGLKDQKVKDAIVVGTEDRLIGDGVSEAQLVINGPGEYEVADFSIRGIAARRHIDDQAEGKAATIYRIEVGDTRIALLGNISDSLSESQLEELGIIDMIILPVGGGGYTLDSVKAAKLVRSIEAKAVVPIHYADNALKYEVPQDDLDLFLKELGGEAEETSKYKVKAQSSLPQVMTIIKLART